MLIYVKIPPDAEQSLACEVFGDPEVQNSKNNHQLIHDQPIEEGRKEPPEEEEHNHNTLGETVDDKAYNCTRRCRRVGVLIHIIPTLHLVGFLPGQRSLLLLISQLDILYFCMKTDLRCRTIRNISRSLLWNSFDVFINNFIWGLNLMTSQSKVRIKSRRVGQPRKDLRGRAQRQRSMHHRPEHQHGLTC